jgi:type IV pilus assembly protein PilC
MELFTYISPQEKVDFARTISVLVESGVSIDNALGAVAEQTRSRSMKKIALRMKARVEKGNPLTEIFAKEEKVFGPLFTSLVRAGENSGTLTENLNFLADWMERSVELKKQVNGALLYPKIVLAITVIVSFGIVFYVLPNIIPLFDSLGVELPASTRAMIWITKFAQNYWYIVLGSTAAALAIFLTLSKVKKTKKKLQWLYLHVPFFGSLIKQYQTILVAQMSATLLKSGMTVNESFSIVAESSDNLVYRSALKRIKKSIEQGNGIGTSMKKYPNLFTPNTLNIIGVGGESGTVQDSFAHISKYYSKEVSSKAKQIPTIIEPIMLVIIAVMVGFTALSIMLPIYSLTGAIQ